MYEKDSKKLKQGLLTYDVNNGANQQRLTPNCRKNNEADVTTVVLVESAQVDEGLVISQNNLLQRLEEEKKYIREKAKIKLERYFFEVDMATSEKIMELEAEPARVKFGQESSAHSHPHSVASSRRTGAGAQSSSRHTAEDGLDVYDGDTFSAWSNVIISTLVFLHLALGTVTFSTLMNWTLLDALYFSVVTATTVGYGDFVPTGDDLHLLWGICYIWLSIFVISACVALVSGLFTTHVERGHETNDTTTTSIDRARTASDVEVIQLHTLVLQKRLARRCAFMLALFFFGVAVMAQLEPTWSLVENIFFITCTISTVGYGVNTPSSTRARGFMAFYILIGVLATSSIVGSTYELLVENRKKQRRVAFFGRRLNARRITEMDTDEDGQVTELEYVCFMLTNTGLVDQEDIDFLRGRFVKLDTDGDRVLTTSDFLINAKQDALVFQATRSARTHDA